MGKDPCYHAAALTPAQRDRAQGSGGADLFYLPGSSPAARKRDGENENGSNLHSTI